MRSVAVNFANNVGWYKDGQPRLIHSLRQHGFTGDWLPFQTFEQLPGCPSHSAVPYAFKLYALREAMWKGYDIAFYADASIYAVSSVTSIFDRIASLGYYLECTEHNLGTWSSDRALAQLGIDREEAFKIPTLVAGCIGFDFRKAVSHSIIEQWFLHLGIFPGSWDNRNGQVSSDPRVRGHRHDQTVLSGIAHKMKLEVLPFESTIFYATPPPSQAVFHCHPTI